MLEDIRNTISDGVGNIKDFIDSATKKASALLGVSDYSLGGFLFDVVKDNQTTLNSEITDHYAEDNLTVQDNVALKSPEVLVKGFVGEWVYKQSLTDKVLQKYGQSLNIVNQYAPKLSSFANKAFQKAQQTSNLLDTTTKSVESLYRMFRNVGLGDSAQTRAYAFFELAWENRMAIKIQTPYRVLDNMYIQTFKAIQGGETKDYSDFEITLKQIRVTSTTTDIKVAEARRKIMDSEKTVTGLVKGQTTSLSSISSWAG